MSTSFERYQKRRLISSYFSVVLSIALVLFLLGMLGLLVLNTKKVADHFKEQIAITVYFNDDAKEEAMQNLTKSLDTASYTRSVTFVSKEEAAKQTKEAIGEDFMEFLDYNPLQNSIDVYMNADFVSSEKVEANPKDSGNDLYVNIDRRLIKIDIPSIYLIEARGDYILIKTSAKNYTVHSTMKKIEEKLPDHLFLKIHRSFIINVDRIIDIEDNSVLIEKDVIPVSRSSRPELMKRLNLL